MSNIPMPVKKLCKIFGCGHFYTHNANDIYCELHRKEDLKMAENEEVKNDVGETPEEVEGDKEEPEDKEE